MSQRQQVETFPLSRIATFDVGAIGRRKHRIAGFIEVDVTLVRERLRALRREGTRVSFTAWFLKSVGLAVEPFPEVQGTLKGRRRRVLFDEVDIALMVEREVESSVVPLPLVVRRCNSKSIVEIQAEMDAAVDQDIRGSGDFELGRSRPAILTSLFYRLPQLLRVAIMRAILARPGRRKELMGTAIVTSVAPGLRFPGWIMPETMHNLAFGLGSVVKKPRVVSGEVRPRDVLHLTLLFDHDVVDGAPAARFVSHLVKTLENCVALYPARENSLSRRP